MEEMNNISDNWHVSNALYVEMCHYIGTPTEVTIRREVMDMEELIYKSVEGHNQGMVMNGGSYREGFRFGLQISM